MQDDNSSVRADVWLWAARFFKTRRLSREAIQAGQVEHNGHPAKPGRAVRAGDEMLIQRAGERYALSVLGVAARRGPASEAQQLYREHEESRAARAEARELRRLTGHAAPRGRPDGHARRALRRLKRGED